MKILEKLRGTGRTTRMLAHAKQLAESGKKVCVVGDNMIDTRRLAIQFGDGSLGIRFITATDPCFTWDRFRSGQGIVGDHTVIVLVDHRTIEERFAIILEMLHQYDA